MACSHRTPWLHRVLVAALLILSGALPVRAQAGWDDRVGAQECCQPLLLHIGARGVALANALTARAGADAVFVNPAALARLPSDEFRVHTSETEIETSTVFSLAFGIGGAGNVGVSYVLIDYGEIPVTDQGPIPTGTLRLLNHALLASFAATLAPGLSAGVTYRVYQERQDCRGTCTSRSSATHGLDLGVQFHPELWPALQLGAAVTHLGPALQVINAEQADPAPVRVRAGAAYEVLHHFSADTTTALWASVDVAGSWRDGVEPVVAGGLELVLDRTIYVRGGHATGSGRTAGSRVGVGLRYDRFDVGIAKAFAGGSTGGHDPYHITFAIGF